MINTRAERENLYARLNGIDLLTKLKPLIEQEGYMMRATDFKFVPIVAGQNEAPPWIYVQSIPFGRCEVYHRVFFKHLQHIHSHCRSCWKVVVRPKNLVQLMDLYEVQKALGVPCKCGVELRDTVHGLYGGYFYTRSKEEGLERYAQVKDVVHSVIDPEMPILLKRYCTEFELPPHGQGDSDKVPLDVTKEEKELEEIIEHYIPPVEHAFIQPKFIVAHILRGWVEFAYQNGDETYKAFTNGEPLYPSYVTYHDELEKGEE